MVDKVNNNNKLSAVILGATGAIGREIVQLLCQNNKWEKVHVIVRRELDTWKDLEGSFKRQIKYLFRKVNSLDELEQTEKWQQFKGANSFFCALGSRTKEGEKVFKLVDYTYCIWGAKIAQLNNIPHFSLLTSTGADAKSMFQYMRVKGEVERDIGVLNFPLYSIFRPGLLMNRDNDDRFIEKVAKYIPFIEKIESVDLAKAMILEAEQVNENFNPLEKQNNKFQFSNKQILNMLKEQKK